MERKKTRLVSLFLAATFVAAVYAFMVIPAIRETWPDLGQSLSPSGRSREFRGRMRLGFAPSAQEAPKGWMIAADGPVLTDGFASSLQLQPEQLLLANAILKVTYQEYLQLERAHSSQEHNQEGHRITTIEAFPAPFQQLEDRVWSKLDQIFNEGQQQRARASIPTRTATSDASRAAKDLVSPGLFGWSGEAVTVETWRDASAWHWTINTRGQSHTQSHPELPAELRRFWDDLQEGAVDSRYNRILSQ